MRIYENNRKSFQHLISENLFYVAIAEILLKTVSNEISSFWQVADFEVMKIPHQFTAESMIPLRSHLIHAEATEVYIRIQMGTFVQGYICMEKEGGKIWAMSYAQMQPLIDFKLMRGKHNSEENIT